VLAPASGMVVAVTNDQRDHRAHRSLLGLLVQSISSVVRAFLGMPGVLGNHVVIQTGEETFVLMAHLRRGSIRVTQGALVSGGELVAECGNSGNTTEPHVHLQVMDAADPRTARGLPLEFVRYRRWVRTSGLEKVGRGVPRSGEVVLSEDAQTPASE
jgi:murein DD-endopeptidase MepM/ murein hydrolase activator NlpD